MKKVLLIFSLLFSFCLISKAQFKEIAAGPEFNEPHSEYSKFLLMKKGNLVFVEVGFRDSIRIRVYNTAHQEIAVTSYTMSNAAERTHLRLREAFEINGDVVLFITIVEEKADIFYRVIIDPNSGQVKKEEKIFELKPFSKKESYALWQDNFRVSKGTDSDDYAIVFCNNLRSEKIKKIEIVLFSKEHVEIGRSFYETAEKEFHGLKCGGMTVIDPEKTGILLVGYTWDIKYGDEGRKLFFALMKKGSSALSITKLNFPQDRVPNDPQLYYNSYSKRLIVAAMCGGKQVDQYLCFLDPETGKTEKVITYNFSDAFYEKGKDIYGKKYAFFGKPVNFFAEKNGSFSVVFEIQDEEMSSDFRWSHDYTSDIVVADFDKNGKLVNNYLVPRKVYTNPSHSLSYDGGFENHYTRFAYIKNNDKPWLLLNDTRENIERLGKNKDPKQVVLVNDCDAFYFPLTGNLPIPSRKYLYRETGEKEEHIQSPFDVSVYDKENDVFITLRLNRDEKKRTKTVNVVWLKPQ